MQGWKLTAAKRMFSQKVETARIFEVIKEMEASGQFPECLDKEDGVHISDVGGWDGGDVLQEPFQYSIKKD